MYGWIWRHLPFGTTGRLLGSVCLATAAAALLWYVVFPAVEPHLPINDGQVTSADMSGNDPGIPVASPSTAASPSPSVTPATRPSAVRSPAHTRTRRPPAAGRTTPPAGPSPTASPPGTPIPRTSGPAPLIW